MQYIFNESIVSFKKNNPLNQKYHDLYTDFVDVRVFSNGTLNIKNLTNLDLHIDSVSEKATKLQNLIDNGQDNQIAANKQRLDNIEKNNV